MQITRGFASRRIQAWYYDDASSHEGSSIFGTVADGKEQHFFDTVPTMGLLRICDLLSSEETPAVTQDERIQIESRQLVKVPTCRYASVRGCPHECAVR